MRSVTGLQEALGRGGFTTAVVLVVVVLLLIIAVMRRRGAFRGARILAGTLLVIGVGGVLSLTLIGPLPIQVAEPRLYVDPVAGARGWYGIAWRPVFDNVVLFVPVGAFAAAVAPRRGLPAVLLGCVALSFGVEAFQYLMPTGRVANAADVLANALGAVIGMAAASLLGARRLPERPRQRREPGSRQLRSRQLRSSVRG